MAAAGSVLNFGTARHQQLWTNSSPSLCSRSSIHSFVKQRTARSKASEESSQPVAAMAKGESEREREREVRGSKRGEDWKVVDVAGVTIKGWMRKTRSRNG